MKIQSSLVVWALAAAVLGGSVACGEVSSNKADASVGMDTAPPGDFTVASNPGTLSVGITGQGTVAIDLVRGEGLTDAVALSVSGAPTGVTTAFDVASLPLGSNTANLTVTVADTASAGTSTLTVNATAGAITHTATLELTLTTITVTGKVRGGRQNITVRIVGKSALISDSMGNFTFTDVKVPYDIYTVGQEGPNASPEPSVFYFRGLTRPDPTISAPSTQLGGVITGFFSGGTITGTRSGTGNATSPVVVLLSNGGTPATSLDASSNYSVAGQWSGFMSNCSNCTLYGLQWNVGSRGEPNAYLGYGSTTPATIFRTGQGANDVDLVFAAPATADITGTISPPAGFPANPALTLTQQLGSSIHEIWNGNTPNATCKIALTAAGKASLFAVSTSGGRSVEVSFPALDAAKDVTYQMPTPPVQIGPANNATGVTAATPIEYSTTPMTVHQVKFDNAAGHFTVFTTAASITIPSVSELPVPTGATYTWFVNGFGPYASVDAAADAVSMEAAVKNDFVGDVHFEVLGASRTFTTQ